MLAKEIVVGGKYRAKVSNKLTTVQVENIRENYKGRQVYEVLNLTTGRRTLFQSAGKFRSSVAPVSS